MSLLKANAVQLGQSLTASQNFTWYQPATPDGTVRLGNGNSGSVTDLVTVSSTGNINLVNDIRWGTWSSGTSGQVVTATTSASGYVAMYTSGLERMRLDSSGNLGLGVTPSAWGSGWSAMQIGGNGSLFADKTAGAGKLCAVTQNAYHNGTNNIYISSDFASRYRQGSGIHIWETAPSGTAGNAISWTQAMTLGVNGLLTLPSLVSTYTTANAANMYANPANGEISRSTSALKYKQDIRDLESIDINKFRPVRYKSKCENDDRNKDHFGIIADEVDAANIKELVFYDEKGEVEGFQYERLTVVLLKAIQELSAQVSGLKTEFNELKQKVNA